MTSRPLVGRTALVTGSAVRVGRAIAEAVAAAGGDVWVHYGRSSQAAAETAEALRSRHGVRASAVQADLTDPEAIDAMFGKVADDAGALDLLVNNAASFESAPFDEVDSEAWDASLAVNARAPHLCARAARPLLEAAAEARGGSSAIVNLADLAGVVPWRRHVQHGVSKAALLHWTRVAALELAPRVRVNAIVPGAILPPPGVDEESDQWRRAKDQNPLGRTGSPAGIGAAVVFLASAEFVTGEVLFVDGGEHLYGSTKR